LNKDASFQVDGDDVKLDMLDLGSSRDHRPEVVTPDDQAQNPNIAKVLKVTILTPSPRWLTRKSNPDLSKKEHVLSFINPDGQKADWKFTLPGPTAVLSASVGAQKVLGGETLKVKTGDEVTLDAAGSQPGDDATPVRYEWTIPNAPPATTQSVKTKFDAAGTYEITLKVTGKDLTDSSKVTIEVT
jgi:hypothetical protein